MASTIIALSLAGGGYLLFRGNFKKVSLNDGASSMNASSDAAPATAGTNSVNNLNVASGSASSLGQLNNASGASQGASTPNRSTAGTSTVDPSTFAQYEKYKDNGSALFGDVQAGSGAALGDNQQATILYKGWLTNGTLFDQSRTDSSGRLQPLAFTEGGHQVIPGMEEGVAGMKAGGIRLIIVPPGQGYGSQGQGNIPGGAVLVFEVQLLDVH